MKILIICLPGVGDTLLYSPAVRGLRKQYPDARIEMLVMFKSSAQLYEHNPNVDKVFCFSFLQKGILKSLAFIKKLRSEKYDISFLAYPSNRIEYSVIHFLIGARKKYGHSYLHKDFSSMTFLNNIRIKEKNHLHNVEENIALMKKFDPLINCEGGLDLYLTEEDEKYAGNWINGRNLENRIKIGIHAGTAVFKNHIKRRWPKENFASLGKELSCELNAAILIFGGPDEYELNREIADGIGKDSYIVKDTSMRQSAALIKSCDIFISNDSALMHTAAATRTPAICLFGPTNPVWVKPYASPHRVVSLNLPCAPCFYYSKKPLTCEAKLDYYCVKGISIKRVLNEALLFLTEIKKDKNNEKA